MTELTLEQLPIHELKRACKEKGIKTKNTDKKADLIKMLRTGETVHVAREAKRMPHISESKTEKSVPMIPKEIKEELEQLAKNGLTWTIDEESGCVNFKRDIVTCANLDQSSVNILRTAKQAFRGRYGAIMPAIEEGNSIQARRIDQNG